MRLLIALIIGMQAFVGYSQSDTTLLKEDISTIVIHEQRLGIAFKESNRTIDLITSEDIKASAANNVAELLNDVAGVDIRQRGPNGVQSDIGIRGGSFDQTLILIDGIKLIDPQTGHHTMNIPIAVDDIERIEILKGPAARIYGQNAFAGAINIITKKRKKNEINIGVHSGEHQLLDTNIGLSNAIGGVSQSISYSRNASDGYKYNTDYKIEHYNYQSKIGSSGNQLNLIASHSTRKFGANGFYASPEYIDQYEETYTTFAAADYRKQMGEWHLNPKVSYRRNKDNYVFLRQNPSVYQNIHISNVLAAEMQLKRSNRLGIFQIGAEYSTLNLESNNLGDRSRNIFSSNVEQRILLLDEKLDIIPGLNFTSFSDLESRVFPGIDIGYKINQRLKIYSNAGYTYRVPTYTDLYYESPAEQGNVNLKPEEALSIELGIKYSKDQFSARSVIFNRRGKDLIDWSKQDSLSKWQPNNISRLTTKGLELGMDWRFRSARKFGLTKVGASYTYISQDKTDEEVLLSRYALEYLKHQLVGVVSVHYGDIRQNIQLRYADRSTLNSYTVVDTKLYYDTQSVRVSLSVNNVFDEEYRESNFVTMPGRWVSIGADINVSY